VIPRLAARARRFQAWSLALTAVLAVLVGGVIWLVATSVPYLASSPTTDPHFGALNACLLSAVPERLGFAVSPDLTRVAAWSSTTLVECGGEPITATTHSVGSVTRATYDNDGALWVTSIGSPNGTSTLMILTEGKWVDRGPSRLSELVGTAHGVLALEADGLLLSLTNTGEVSASRSLAMLRGVKMASNSTGQWVAIWGGGHLAVVNARSLESLPAEVPCAATHVWWRPNEPVLVVECVDLTLEVNVLDSNTTLLDPRKRVRSFLAGKAGVYVQPCDVLPCSADAPR
jgi:hypothetical protein